jgi:hypothetical protein
MPSIAQVEGSGTEGVKAVMVALPVLNPAVKKPDENHVAFVSITNWAVSESLGTPSKKLKPTVTAVGRSTVVGGTPVESVKSPISVLKPTNDDAVTPRGTLRTTSRLCRS